VRENTPNRRPLYFINPGCSKTYRNIGYTFDNPVIKCKKEIGNV